MQAVAIVLICMGAAIGYGIVHDQITARVCIEYFTVAHPVIIETDNPTVLGLLWGVVATWWVGLMLGLPLAAAARYGPWPKRSATSLVRPILWLLSISGVIAFIAGMTGWSLASAGVVQMPDFWAEQIPRNHQARFIADAATHLASYGVGFIGGIVIIGCVVFWRYRHRSDGVALPADQTKH